MRSARNIVAVDFGAESGRLVLCRWDGDQGSLEEIHRFPNAPSQVAGHLVWDLERLWQEVLQGLKKASVKTEGRIDSVGVDGWGVDYVLLDASGERIGNAYCYRDARNERAMPGVYAKVPQPRLYEITGIQFMPFNTIYQLCAHKEEFPDEWARTTRWVTLPEYFHYRLSGVAVQEFTEASTTQLLDVRARQWSKEIATALGLDLEKFPPIVQAGTVLGKLRPEVSDATGLKDAQVVAPACHDTGSAVAGIPFPHEGLVFISSGTWSLVGIVLREPVVNPEHGSKFTNEGGVAGSIRFLQNVIGLWLLQECLREWNAQGQTLTAAGLASQCMETSPEGPYFHADETEFLAPGNMIERINQALRREGFGEERRPAQLAAIIFRSLARRYAAVVAELGKLSGRKIQRICIVGGGVKNEALNRLTEKLTGVEVVRGPSESTAAGNIAVQIAALENSVSLDRVQSISARLKLASASS
jgi:rhamnulokinase